MENRATIRKFVTRLLEIKGERTDIKDDEPLVTAGLLDSLDVMNTVVFMEQEFQLDFSARPFSPDDFDSIDSICQLLD